MNVGDLLDAQVLDTDGAALGVVVDVRFALEIVGEHDDQEEREQDRENPERPLSVHTGTRDAVGAARLVGLLVSPHGGGAFLGYERTGVRSPWPIAQLVRRRLRGTFLVDWADVADVRIDPEPATVRLLAGWSKRSPELYARRRASRLTLCKPERAPVKQPLVRSRTDRQGGVMDDKVKLAGVLLGGYLLGRSKMMKTALVIAGGVAASRAMGGSGGAGLVGRLRDSVLSSPEAERLRGDVAGKVVAAGKAAAITAATKRIDALSATLQDQSERLRDAQAQAAPKSGEEAPGEENGGEDASEKKPAEKKSTAPARSSGTRKSTGKSTGTTDSGTAAKSAGSSAKKPAASRQRTTSGARKQG